MKTYSAKPKEVTRAWYLIDASEDSLGRISTIAARILIGKNKPMFTSHIDCGDYLVIVNAGKLRVTGDKLESKKYYHHSQHPSGLRERSLKEQLERDPTKVIVHAIRGMLPDNKLRQERLGRLKVYAFEEHPHSGQQPEKVILKQKGSK